MNNAVKMIGASSIERADGLDIAAAKLLNYKSYHKLFHMIFFSPTNKSIELTAL